MSCCGNMRKQLASSFNPVRPPHAGPRRPVGAGSRFPMGVTYFEYVGTTAITAVGAATGRQYRFPTPGVPVAADIRDRVSLAKVPNLREVR